MGQTLSLDDRDARTSHAGDEHPLRARIDRDMAEEPVDRDLTKDLEHAGRSSGGDRMCSWRGNYPDRRCEGHQKRCHEEHARQAPMPPENAGTGRKPSLTSNGLAGPGSSLPRAHGAGSAG